MHLLEIIRRKSRYRRQGEQTPCQTIYFEVRSLERQNDVLLFHLSHLSAQTADVSLFPLFGAQWVILQQQLLQLVRSIKVRLLGLVKRFLMSAVCTLGSAVRTSGMKGAVCSFESRVSQSMVENQGWLFNSRKPSPLGLHASRLEGSLSRN